MESAWVHDNDIPEEMNLFYGSIQDPMEPTEETVDGEDIATD
jgi:hypothetical protein